MYSPKEGIETLRRVARRDTRVRRALTSLKGAQDVDAQRATDEAYVALEAAFPAHDRDGTLIYSRVDATIVSRVAP